MTSLTWWRRTSNSALHQAMINHVHKRHSKKKPLLSFRLQIANSNFNSARGLCRGGFVLIELDQHKLICCYGTGHLKYGWYQKTRLSYLLRDVARVSFLHSKSVFALNRKIACPTMRFFRWRHPQKIVECPSTTIRSAPPAVRALVPLIGREFLLRTDTAPTFVPAKKLRRTKSKLHEQPMATVCECAKNKGREREGVNKSKRIEWPIPGVDDNSLQTAQQLHANEKQVVRERNDCYIRYGNIDRFAERTQTAILLTSQWPKLWRHVLQTRKIWMKCCGRRVLRHRNNSTSPLTRIKSSLKCLNRLASPMLITITKTSMYDQTNVEITFKHLPKKAFHSAYSVISHSLSNWA